MSVYKNYTGKYMPKEQRDEVVKDTRNTHFTFGQADADFSSAYKHQFPANSISANSDLIDIKRRVQKDSVVLGGSPKAD